MTHRCLTDRLVLPCGATRRIRRALAGGMALALLGAAACRDGGERSGMEPGGLPAPGWLSPGPPTLLQLGQSRFSAKEFGVYRDGISRLITDAGPLGDTENTIILNQFVENRLLLVAAREAGLAVSGADRKTARQTLGFVQEKGVELPDDEILIQKFLQGRFAGKISVTEAEAEEYYNRHAGEYVSPTRYHVREILVDDPALARQIHQELQSGGILRFGRFASQFSKAPSASAEGDLGYFEKGQLPAEFERIILALKPGRISDVVQTPYGFHIFCLVEIVRSHPQKFYEAKGGILESLRMEKERALQAQLLAELGRKYPPRVFKKALDFQPDLNTLSQLIVLEAANEK